MSALPSSALAPTASTITLTISATVMTGGGMTADAGGATTPNTRSNTTIQSIHHHPPPSTPYPEFLRSDEFLKPRDANDPLLQALADFAVAGQDDEWSDSDSEGAPASGLSSGLGAAAPPPPPQSMTATSAAPKEEAGAQASITVRELAQLQSELEHTKAKLAVATRLAGLDDEGEPGGKGKGGKDGEGQDNDTYYFNSYAGIGIHETMLRDTVSVTILRLTPELFFLLPRCPKS